MCFMCKAGIPTREMKQVKVRMSDQSEGTILLPADQADVLNHAWKGEPIPIHTQDCKVSLHGDTPPWDCTCGAWVESDHPRRHPQSEGL